MVMVRAVYWPLPAAEYMKCTRRLVPSGCVGPEVEHGSSAGGWGLRARTQYCDVLVLCSRAATELMDRRSEYIVRRRPPHCMYVLCSTQTVHELRLMHSVLCQRPLRKHCQPDSLVLDWDLVAGSQ